MRVHVRKFPKKLLRRFFRKPLDALLDKGAFFCGYRNSSHSSNLRIRPWRGDERQDCCHSAAYSGVAITRDSGHCPRTSRGSQAALPNSDRMKTSNVPRSAGPRWRELEFTASCSTRLQARRNSKSNSLGKVDARAGRTTAAGRRDTAGRIGLQSSFRQGEKRTDQHGLSRRGGSPRRG
jgi:hypothetical protein